MQRVEAGTALARSGLLLDQAPRPATASPLRGHRGIRFEVPVAVALHPPLPDERRAEAIAVHHEVEAEASLHAGGTHVRGAFLDPRAVHADDVVAARLEVDLTPHAAVWAHTARGLLRHPHGLGLHLGERDDVVNRTGGTHADTFAAPGTARMLGIAIRAHDDLGELTAQRHVEHANHLDIRAGAYAARAENAGGHVMLNQRIAFPLVAHAEGQIGAPDGGNVVAMDELFELVAAFMLGNVAGGVSLEQHAEDRFPV